MRDGWKRPIKLSFYEAHGRRAQARDGRRAVRREGTFLAAPRPPLSLRGARRRHTRLRQHQNRIPLPRRPGHLGDRLATQHGLARLRRVERALARHVVVGLAP